MKTPLPLLALAVLMLPFAPLSAATYYWDINGSATGATSDLGGSATGTWNGTNAFFTTDAAGTSATTTFVANQDLIFSAGTNATGASIITVGGGIAPGFSSLTLNAGTVTFNSAGGTLDRFVARGTNTITLGATAGGSATFNTVITLSGGFPNQTFTNQNTTAGRDLVFNGAIRISGAGNEAITLTLANTSAGGTTVNTSLGVRDGASTNSTLGLIINNTGSGVTTLAGGNVYTGTTTVRAGTLVVASDAISTTLANQTYSRSASTFTLAGFNNGDRVVFNEGTTPTGLTSGVVYYVVNQSGSTFELSETLGGSVIALTGTQTSIANAISKAGALGATNSTVQLGDGSTGSNTLSLLVSGAHTLQRAISVNNLGTGTTLGGNTDHHSVFTGNITLNKNVNVQSVTTGSNSVTFQTGLISGTGGVTKIGSGTVTFTAANPYIGATQITAGTLLISGSGSINSTSGVAINGATSVLRYESSVALTQTVSYGASGGTFLYNSGAKYTGGSGSLAAGTDDTVGGDGVLGNVTIANGGTLTPGEFGNASVGNLTVDSLTLQTGATNHFDVVSAGSFDSISSAGAIQFAGALNLSFSSILGDGSTLALFDGGSYAGNFDSIVAGGAYVGSFAIEDGFLRLQQGEQVLTFNHLNGVLSVSAIPEPSTALLLMGGLMGVFFLRRRRV